MDEIHKLNEEAMQFMSNKQIDKVEKLLDENDEIYYKMNFKDGTHIFVYCCDPCNAAMTFFSKKEF